MRPQAIFQQVNVVTADVPATVAFYRRLGVLIEDERQWRTSTGTHHVPVGQSSVALAFDSAAFAGHWNSAWRDQPGVNGRVVLSFRLPSRDAVDDTFRDLTSAGHRGLQAPYDAFWGARYAIVEDPSGLAVGLMSPDTQDKHSAPPDV